jgi:esterase FrsA
MRGWGIPGATLRRVTAATSDMWREGPGGWAYEWSREAEAAERQGRWFQAAMCYGAAKFPCISTELQERSYAKQIECYSRASGDFPCRFQRLEIEVPYRDRTTLVCVHSFAPKTGTGLPLICLSGGVDTLKMELHKLALAIALLGRFRVAVIDMPGTGESAIALAGDAHVIYEGVLAKLHDAQKKGVWGVSFGGHWAAKLACLSAVDAAVDMGGPIGKKLFDDVPLPNGMAGIVANALGDEDLLAAPAAVRADLGAQFSLEKQGLLANRTSSPLLVFNGKSDPYIPVEDTMVFAGWRESLVWLFEDGDHCAANRIKRIVPAAVAWLRLSLHGDTAVNRLIASAATRVLPRRCNGP